MSFSYQILQKPVWTLDGVAFPRNPEAYDTQWDKANVQYSPQADGSQKRLRAPKLIRGADLTMSWTKADRRLLNFIHQYLNLNLASGDSHILLPASILPAMSASIFLDTPKRSMSSDIINSRLGEGGVRHDISVVCRMNTFFQSVATLMSNPTTASVKLAFGGPIGNGLDGIPVWDGRGWVFNPAPGNPSRQDFYTINLGTADWSPVIRITGPFVSMGIHNFADVDGTGQGLFWQWTGTPLLLGDYVLFDTNQRRTYLFTVATNNLVEVYTFLIQTNSTFTPFSYWPPYPSGDFQIGLTGGGMSAATQLDLTNAQSNTFSYW